MNWEVTLLRPWWLAALPLILALGWWLHRRRAGLGDWERTARPELLAAMAALGRVERGGADRTTIAAVAAAGLAAIALAGPAVERRDAASWRNLDGAVFVMDLSESVTGAARWPQMLSMAQFGVAAMGTRPGGLVVYAGDAYVATDMTADLRQLGQTVSLLGPGIVPDPGSRPERGLALALRMLEQSEMLAGDVVLFTDGDGLGPEALALGGRIAERGARLSVVALGPPGPAAAALSAAGGGRAFAADEVEAFAAWVGSDARATLARQDYPMLFWRDLGRWGLLPALVALTFAFRRRAA